jgi:hypothetical protein
MAEGMQAENQRLKTEVKYLGSWYLQLQPSTFSLQPAV